MPSRTDPPAPPRKRRPADDPLTRFDFQSDSLGYALRRAQLRVYERFYEMLGTMDLSPARVTALSIIAMEPEINQATLAKRLDVAGPSVLKLVDALEEGGLIRREDVADDRRRYNLVLTPAGRAKVEALRSALAAYEERLAQRLSAAERAQLMALLERVAT
ncbi:MAG: MarR family transcriptional regulator [Piscinibacter sp.]|uniref:MarR family winged helix-turn-helix transcriptional regulator n=1 Tax=Piscinibacter sp. TaxID=1903157 RepID=UPI002586CFEF|nr:MarR family transcriptional regulator [Piscinibacter sp.]MCW5667149.1 MarR family transcriptional regulator [Piscinibacter sp.]